VVEESEDASSGLWGRRTDHFYFLGVISEVQSAKYFQHSSKTTKNKNIQNPKPLVCRDTRDPETHR
jgi:hypothetical protein